MKVEKSNNSNEISNYRKNYSLFEKIKSKIEIKIVIKSKIEIKIVYFINNIYKK